jgi:outer membrane protein TolC
MELVGSRFDVDAQLLWEFSAFGLGNKARTTERRAEHEAATLELFRMQDRIAAEVTTGWARANAASARLALAGPNLTAAAELVNKSIEGMTQTRRIGETQTLIVRPQEVVAAVQAFAQANTDYFAAIADYNRSQFRLYRALGHPAGAIASILPTTPAK